MNRFEKGIRQLAKRLGNPTTGGGITIRYQRGDSYVIITNAWQAMQAFRVEDANSSRVEWADRAFAIPVDALILNDELVQPQRGDVIIVSFPEPLGQQRFEVSAPIAERPWRYLDNHGLIYHVNTKRVKNV